LSNSVRDWESHSQLVEGERLRVVTAGSPPSDPAGLLEAPALGNLVERLKAVSDVVIIDAPAALGLSDTATVTRVADASLLVLESDSVSTQDALRAKQLLTATGVPIIGVVLNQMAQLPGMLTYKYYANLRRKTQPEAVGREG
jgi:Mrp family chromosome partitioning ATPase